MKNPILLIFLCILPAMTLSCPSGQGPATSSTVVTWNIRYNNPGDKANAWPNRKEKVFSMIRDINPQILCMQEVLAGQLEDLAKALPRYSWFGAGRDDGRRQGEYVPVFFDTTRYHFIKGNHFWLSESPDIPGKLGWDAVCARMVTWVQLSDQSSHDTLFVFNTHFDHIGATARLMSAKLLTRKAASISGRYPAIITGDFNSLMTDSSYVIINEAGFRDARLASKAKPIGPEYTFCGFDASKKPGDRIDFIYLKNTKPVKNYIVRDDSFNGFYPSDHLPVIINVE